MALKLIKEHSWFLIMLLVCVCLRMAPLFNYQFTYDELSGLERTRFSGFGELIEKGVKVDAHPAFVQVLIFCLVKLVGYTTWVIKLPFLMFSFGAVIYGYALARRNFSAQAGLVIASLLSFSLVFVFYAPIARMYITGVFFSMALLYYFFEIVFGQKQNFTNYALYSFFLLCSALNQHLNALFALTLYLSAFIFLQGKHYKNYLIAGAASVVAYLPHLKVSLYQLGVGGIGIEQGGWLDKPPADSAFAFLKILFGTGNSYWLVLITVMVCAVLRRNYSLNRKQLLLLGLFVINYLIIYFYSIFRAPIYQHSMMLFSGSTMLLLVASLSDSGNKFVCVLTPLILSGWLIFKTYVSKEYFNQAVDTVYEYQFERTDYYQKKYGKPEVKSVFFDADENMRQIYSLKFENSFNEGLLAADSVALQMKHFANFVSGLKANYLILASSLPAQQAVAKERFPYLIENTQTQGIHFKVYSRLASDKEKVVEDDEITFNSVKDENNILHHTQSPITNSGLKIDSLIEFPYTIYADYHQLVKNEGNVILLSCVLDAGTNPDSELEACINAGVEGTNELYGYSARRAGDFVAGPDSVLRVYTDYFAGTSHKRAKPIAKIGFYVWNRKKEKSTIKSFNIQVVNYWPQKWQFWD